MSFTPGQKVVCTNADFSMYPMIHEHYNSLPQKDKTYIVREIRPVGADGGILLEELKNGLVYFPHFGGKMEAAFNPNRFSPLDELLSEEAEEAVEELLKEVELELM